jgi:hypothetical protein
MKDRYADDLREATRAGYQAGYEAACKDIACGDAFRPLARSEDPYLKGEGGNCGTVRVTGRPCPVCWRRDGEWHQDGCPEDKL